MRSVRRAGREASGKTGTSIQRERFLYYRLREERELRRTILLGRNKDIRRYIFRPCRDFIDSGLSRGPGDIFRQRIKNGLILSNG